MLHLFWGREIPGENCWQFSLTRTEHRTWGEYLRKPKKKHDERNF
jgi:hypothetical protein